MPDIFDFSSAPDAYAVMGNPVGHSKSPQIHAAFARQTGERMVYTAIQVDPGGFAQAAGNFCANGGKGLNVTVPFKQDAFVYVQTRSPRAELAGAVNTIVFDTQGNAFGDNTDGVGLLRDLVQNLKVTVADRRVLVLGAGGAVRGVLGPLLEARPARVVVANRTPDRAHELAAQFSAIGQIEGASFDALAGQRFDIIINGTSASLQGEVPPLPAQICAVQCCCYDMMYGAVPTAFMRWAYGQGATHVMDGLGMLVEQAAESFFIWRGKRPTTAAVIADLRAALA
jgi:shikimate dehydrogenase